MDRQVSSIIRKIKKKKLTLAFAESVTCGFMAHEMGTVKGASEIFAGSIVCYSPLVKTGVLNVSSSLIKKYSAESPQVTKALIKNLTNIISADLYGAVTGLSSADPKALHPAGTIFLCASDGKKFIAEKKLFRGTPLLIRKKTFRAMIELIDRLI